jgi:hypothetical protein
MKTAIIGVTAWLFAVSTAFADVQLTMQNGRVSLVARDATVRQILTEWARVGHTKIVNMERVPGGPVTLELINVPESQALDVLLRTLSGYITAPRPVEAVNLSRFDRIIIMPTLAAARPASASTPPPPVFQQGPQFNNQRPADDDGDDQESPPAGAARPPSRGPVFNTFPQPQVVNPQTGLMPQPGMPAGANAAPQTPAAPTAPATYPGAPTAPYGGVAVPGMVAPPPPAPPGESGQPVRRPGGRGGQ